MACFVLDKDEKSNMDNIRLQIRNLIIVRMVILLFAAIESKKGKLRKFSDKPAPAKVVDHLLQIFLSPDFLTQAFKRLLGHNTYDN